ncbi:FAD-binding protein [Planococcus sp. ISL-110]|uniref:FAD-binding protein n=1 Tax=Planococcus sp. ISL-110 TaxID=2819167 RepID=UPI001BE61857|nr:FAD-binding protein [Planococcus sp. ISL-110]MBT2572028.1 FAD-binding protein [Planococcus sp. ISL-110]
MVTEKKIYSNETDVLSRYKTNHFFKNYAEIETIDDFSFYLNWAKKNGKNIFILGNGSNTLFAKKNIEALVLKNKIPSSIECISEEKSHYRISSNTLMSKVLPFCFKNSLDSFYYLASVPATIGGALAMNAGEARSKKSSIYDYVLSVEYIDENNDIKNVMVEEMNLDFRKTMFTGCQNKFILSAVFQFPRREFNGLNPIKERIAWSKKHQDNIAPNCGSVFNQGYGRILKLIKGLKIGETKFSSKTQNWINNNSKSHRPIVFLIFVVKLLHIITFKKCNVELIIVK